MQSVKFYALPAVLFMLVVSIACDSLDTTMSASVPVTTVSSKINDASPANMQVKVTESPVQNDEPKDSDGITQPPTRIPSSDAAALPTQPPILHNPSAAGDMPSVTTTKPNGTMATTTGTVGNIAANTDKKDSKQNGVSKGGPEILMVTSLIVLVLSALYA